MRGNREGSKEERRGERRRGGWGKVEKRKEGKMSRGNTY